MISSSQRFRGRACCRCAGCGLLNCGAHCAASLDHRSAGCCAIRAAHRHFFRKYCVAQSSTFSFERCASTARVALLMNSGHGSRSSSLVSSIRCSRLVSEGLLATSSVEWVVSLSLSVVGFIFRLGVPRMRRTIRRCVRCSVVSMFLLSVHAALPYMIVGVTVLSNSFRRDLSG